MDLIYKSLNILVYLQLLEGTDLLEGMSEWVLRHLTEKNSYTIFSRLKTDPAQFAQEKKDPSLLVHAR